MTAALTLRARRDPEAGPMAGVRRTVDTGTRRRRIWIRRIRAAAGWLILIGALVAVWPARFGGAASFVVVQGRSMEPTMHIGDVLFVRSSATYRPGDVIVYVIPDGQPGSGTRVAHRLERIDDAGVFVLRGDNNSHVDPFQPTAEHVVGRSILNLGPAPRLALAAAPYSAAFVIGLGVVLLLWPTPSTTAPRLADEQEAVPSHAR